MKKIITVIGARPQFIKSAPVSKALHNAGITEIIVHSGQHYDANMSDIFWAELGLPAVKYHLEVGSGTHAQQTGQIMVKFEEIVLSKENNVDAVLVYGDTNTTLAVALVASKLQIPLVHIEAGLRSFNRSMPEEVNRILTDNVSDWLFCSSQVAVKQLASEGISRGVHNVGDVMYDAFEMFGPMCQDKMCAEIEEETFSLFTLHRQGNTETPAQVNTFLASLQVVPHTVYWPVHPRIKNWKEQLDIPANVKMIKPLSYLQMLAALRACTFVFTDSGGLQKEAYWAGKQCITFREDTEWVETLDGDWNRLVAPIASEVKNAIENKPSIAWKPLYGNGKAAEMIVEILQNGEK